MWVATILVFLFFFFLIPHFFSVLLPCKAPIKTANVFFTYTVFLFPTSYCQGVLLSVIIRRTKQLSSRCKKLDPDLDFQSLKKSRVLIIGAKFSSGIIPLKCLEVCQQRKGWSQRPVSNHYKIGAISNIQIEVQVLSTYSVGMFGSRFCIQACA